jgi:hypothetical protein
MHKFCPFGVTIAAALPSMGGRRAGDGAMKEQSEGCESGPAGVLVAVLRRLRHRRDEVAAALDGASLRLEITLTESPDRPVHRVMFSREGNVLLVQPENLAGDDYDPHVEFRCAPDDLRGVVLGDVPLTEAVERGTVVAHTALGPYGELHALVAEELRNLLAGKGRS